MPPPKLKQNDRIEKILLIAFSSITKRVKLPGLKRFVRWIYNPDTQPKNRFIFTVPHEGLKIKLDIAYFIDWNIFFFNEYDRGITRIMRKMIRPEFTCLDIGAHIGTYTLLMAKLANQIYAVEPVPGLIEKLNENIKLNQLHHIKVLPVILSGKAETLTLYYPANHPIGREGSLYRKNVPVEECVKSQMQAKTIDQVMEEENCRRLDFIKIDVEGHELPILLGGEKSIGKHKPAIIFEYDDRTWGNAGFAFQEAGRFFTKLGYSLYAVQSRSIKKIDEKNIKPDNILALPS